MAWNRDELAIRVQRKVATALQPLIYLLVAGWLRLGRGYRVRDLARVREQFRSLVQTERGPWIICANHLSLIDSMIILWALASPWRYLVRPGLFAWNLPEKRNFYHNLFWRALCYAGKCIPVTRGGSQEDARKTFARIRYLLSRKDSIMIFPEGTRSRAGRIDTRNFAYAVGRIVQSCPQARVLCVYLRATHGGGHCDFPAKRERFHVSLQAFSPATRETGLRGTRDISFQVIQRLSEMEEAYFANARAYRQ